MSPRERTLVWATAAAAGGMALFLTIFFAWNAMDELDREIAARESTLSEYTMLAARLQQVDLEYGKVAEKHATAQNEAEIHDALRDEITRLSFIQPPPPGSPPSKYTGARLVEFPQIPRGALNNEGGGYQEYRLKVPTKPAPITSVAMFLQRLQESTQLLRVDAVDIKRIDPADVLVTAEISITRAIISADVAAAPVQAPAPPLDDKTDKARNGKLDEWDATAAAFAEWNAKDVTLTQAPKGVPGGGPCLEAKAGEGPGSIQQEQVTLPGKTYLLTFDAACDGNVQITVAQSEPETELAGAGAIASGGAWRRYAVRFTPPQSDENSVSVMAPLLKLEAGARVLLDNVTLVRDAGEPE